VRYDGADGLTLSQITQLSYKVMYSAADAAPIGEAYLRIFLNNDNDDVIFDATQCATTVPAKNVFTTFEVVGSGVRYDDDSCDGAGDHNFPGSPAGQQTWASVLAHHGTETISGIYVTTGFTGGSDLTSAASLPECERPLVHLRQLVEPGSRGAAPAAPHLPKRPTEPAATIGRWPRRRPRTTSPT
jgi:hypothetical protein